MTSEKDGTVIPGADRPSSVKRKNGQGRLDLLPDPAGLRDLAARFREDAAIARGTGVKEHFLKSAEEAESRAEAIEASTLWMAPSTQ